MGKIKTLPERKTSIKNLPKKQPRRAIKPGVGVEEFDPNAALLNDDLIAGAIWECLKSGDPEGVVEVIATHLEACNRTKMAKKAALPKTTFYYSLRSKNPTIKTLAKMVQMTHEVSD